MNILIKKDEHFSYKVLQIVSILQFFKMWIDIISDTHCKGFWIGHSYVQKHEYSQRSCTYKLYYMHFEDRVRARICPGDSFKRAGLSNESGHKKGPKSDHRLPGAPVFCVLESQLTRPEKLKGEGPATGADPLETFWKLHYQFLRFASVSAPNGPSLPGSSRTYRLPPTP